MKKIDWIRKLTSRKFWLSVASFVSMLIVALGGAESVATQVTGLIMAGAALGSVPIILIFLMFQKFFTRGITMGAVKG